MNLVIPSQTAGRSSSRLEAEDLSLERGGWRILQSVHVTFDPGTVTALVGPSGAGKTSLLRCLNRLDEPSAGRVLIDGVDLRRIDPCLLRRRVGMIFQVPAVLPGDVRANLVYGLDHPEEAHLIEALDAAALPAQALTQEAATLSVGQAQRLCIARALVRQPDALLLDEPTASLDPDATAVIETLVLSLAAQGLTVVMVTHDPAQAARVASRTVLLADGQVVAAGTPHEVRAHWPIPAPS